MLFAVIVKIYFIDNIDDLAQVDAVFHVVIVVFKGIFDNSLRKRGCFVHGKIFERGKKFVVDKTEQAVAREGFAVAFVFRPCTPAEVFGDYGRIFGLFKFPFGFLRVIDFQKQKPNHLFYALGVAAYALVFAHDVLQAFYKIIQTHGFFPLGVDFVLQFFYGLQVAVTSAEIRGYFLRCAVLAERVNGEQA